VRVLVYSDLERTGCDWHPSARDQIALADRLGRVIEGFAEMWRRGSDDAAVGLAN
jgi:hypothetical protein